jgi:flagellar hook-associated protein 1 FlgK
MGISTFNGLNTAFRGLQAQQRALDTITHNIANASTEGYTRQEAVIVAAPALAAPSVFGMVLPGQLGQGAEIQGYQRFRDQFTDNALREQLGRQGGAGIAQQTLQRIELSLPEPGDNGLQSIMAKFWSAMQDVSSNPENVGARAALVQQAQTMATAFNGAASDLASQRADADAQANAAVGQINAIASQIDALNASIKKLVGVGQQPNDLLDARDKLIDDLSQIASTTVTYSGNNVATVIVGGLTVVDPTGVTARTRADFDAQFPSQLSATSGSLGALIDAYQNVIPSYQAQLDNLAVALHDDINGVHQGGFDLNGNPGGLFFAGATITSASQLAVDPAMLADPKRFAAAGSATAGPGDSGNVLTLIGLRTGATAPPVSSLGTTYDDYYTSLISGLGVAAQTASRGKDTVDAVVNTLTDQRQSVSGVSLDEEMTNLVQYQHAFAAAGRAITTMDQMLDTIINMVNG